MPEATPINHCCDIMAYYYKFHRVRSAVTGKCLFKICIGKKNQLCLDLNALRHAYKQLKVKRKILRSFPIKNTYLFTVTDERMY